MQELEHLSFQNGGVKLHAVAAGPRDGPAVLLLHGFPEFWYGWRHQIEPLAGAGFRVIAPDGRGYNESSKPSGIRSYALPQLTADVIAIADQLGRDQIYLAGHDWGAAVAWNTALTFPSRIAKLAILNVPHPKVMQQYLKRSPRQMLKSWYILLFQLPTLPEVLFSEANFKIGVASLTRSSRPGTFSHADLERYRQAWKQPGAVQSMIDWYRALARYPVRPTRVTLDMPTLILWGRQDRFLIPEMAEASLQYCQSAKLVWFEQSTHWLHHEEPEAVNEQLIGFFTPEQSAFKRVVSTECGGLPKPG